MATDHPAPKKGMPRSATEVPESESDRRQFLRLLASGAAGIAAFNVVNDVRAGVLKDPTPVMPSHGSTPLTCLCEGQCSTCTCGCGCSCTCNCGCECACSCACQCGCNCGCSCNCNCSCNCSCNCPCACNCNCACPTGAETQSIYAPPSTAEEQAIAGGAYNPNFQYASSNTHESVVGSTFNTNAEGPANSAYQADVEANQDGTYAPGQQSIFDTSRASTDVSVHDGNQESLQHTNFQAAFTPNFNPIAGYENNRSEQFTYSALGPGGSPKE